MINKEQFIMIKNYINQGLNKTEIGKMLGIDRKTVWKYSKQDTLPSYKKVKERETKLKPYKEYIKNRLETYNLTSEKLYEEIKKQGFKGKYGIVNIFVSKLKKKLRNKAILRFETMPGEQAQVDWGYFGKFYDKEQRKVISLHCFFMILGYSRTLYIEFFERAHLTNFLKGHNNAFKYFGGYTREILYDNLKSVVIKRKLRALDSEFNKKFMDYAGYYGFLPILCRPYKPNTKGKVENSVNYAKKNFFAGEEFYSLRDINQKAKEWLYKINNRKHGTTHELPFERLKREGLISIENKQLYDVNISVFRKVNRDCHFSYDGNKYSVPFKYADKEVSVKEVNGNIKIIYRNEEIAVHELNLQEKGMFITIPSHIEELKEIRKSHGIRKPKKKKIYPSSNNNLFLRKNISIPNVHYPDLSKYEEVCVL